MDGLMGGGTKCDDLCVTCNAHQKASPMEETLNNQVDKLAQPDGIRETS